MTDRVLYLGMAYDIAMPLSIVPNVTTIYSIDLFNGYATDGTIEGQRQDIRKILLEGDTFTIASDSSLFEESDIQYLKGKSTIIDDHYYVDDKYGGVWRLKFVYESRKIELVVYSLDFVKTCWPEEVTNISHIIATGSYSWEQLVSHNLEGQPVIKMLLERTTDTFRFYAYQFCNPHFEMIAENFYGDCGKVAFATVDKTNGKANIEKLFHPWFLDGTYGINRYGEFVPIEEAKDPEKNKMPSVNELLNDKTLRCGFCESLIKEMDPLDCVYHSREHGKLFCLEECKTNFLINEPKRQKIAL